MIVGVRSGRAPAPVDVVREIDFAHVASTRGCAFTGTIGVPFGTQVDAPTIVASGTPPPSTRTAPVSHCPVTHGLPLELSAHPAIAYGDAIVTAGCPERSTRGNGAAGVATPACVQRTTAPRCRAGAGTTPPSTRRR